MGIEVPPFIAAAFRADALTVFELRYFNGNNASPRHPSVLPFIAGAPKSEI
jgi:hypothetical protein